MGARRGPRRGSADRGRPRRRLVLRALLLGLRGEGAREGRAGHEGGRQPRPPALPRHALPARRRRDRPPLRSRPSEEAARPHPEARRGRVRGGELGRRPEPRRRGAPRGEAPARPGGGGALHPWLGRHVVQALHEGVGLAERRCTLVRAVPRAARGGLSPHVRHAARIARADRPRQRAGDHAHRQPPRREHAQHPGAGARRGDRARRPARRGRPALLGRREQGALLAAHQARHRHRAPPRLDERDPGGEGVRRRVPRAPRGRPRGAPRARRRQDAGVGLPDHRHPPRAHPRQRAPHRVGAARLARPPRPPHHLVWRRHPARAGDGDPLGPARQLGPARRLREPREAAAPAVSGRGEGAAHATRRLRTGRRAAATPSRPRSSPPACATRPSRARRSTISRPGSSTGATSCRRCRTAVRP